MIADYIDNEWECSICLSNEFNIVGMNTRLEVQICKHIFHLGCIQQHYIMKNKIWKQPQECVMECPLCRSKTIKNNWGVKVVYNEKTNEMLLKKRDKVLHFPVKMYGKDMFKRDIRQAKEMMQQVANFCFDVEAYFMVVQCMSMSQLNEQYVDNHNKCVKLIQLPNIDREYDEQYTSTDKDGKQLIAKKEVYIERSYGI